MRYVSKPVLAAALVALAFAAAPAKAHVFAAKITAPSAVENVACRIVRERIQRFPFAPAEFREREVCEPDRVVNVGDCVVRRERVVRPDGSVVFRKIKRCD
jgi:hypothetical protein